MRFLSHPQDHWHTSSFCCKKIQLLHYIRASPLKSTQKPHDLGDNKIYSILCGNCTPSFSFVAGSAQRTNIPSQRPEVFTKPDFFQSNNKTQYDLSAAPLAFNFKSINYTHSTNYPWVGFLFFFLSNQTTGWKCKGMSLCEQGHSAFYVLSETTRKMLEI